MAEQGEGQRGAGPGPDRPWPRAPEGPSAPTQHAPHVTARTWPALGSCAVTQLGPCLIATGRSAREKRCWTGNPARTPRAASMAILLRSTGQLQLYVCLWRQRAPPRRKAAPSHPREMRILRQGQSHWPRCGIRRWSRRCSVLRFQGPGAGMWRCKHGRAQDLKRERFLFAARKTREICENCELRVAVAVIAT
jgi:hypothetical protein